MRINKENTIAVAIDFQEKLLPHMHNAETIQNNAVKLIKGLKALGIPTIVTQQYTKGLGNTTPEISNALEEFEFIEKSTFSCYLEPEFANQLSQSNKKDVIIFGIESHVCVLQTALDLLYNNYNPIIVSNAISSRNTEDKEIALWRMRDEGCTITSYESVLFELCKKAGTEEFKAISKIVK